MKARMAIWIVPCWLIFLSASLAGGSGSVVNSLHNLSRSGPGEIKATSETRVCIFCHSSHNASTDGPLWNHKTTQPGKFRTYSRATLEEYRCADSRPIVDSVFFDVKNHTGKGHSIIPEYRHFCEASPK